jgi:hypothetical protein
VIGDKKLFGEAIVDFPFVELSLFLLKWENVKKSTGKTK